MNKTEKLKKVILSRYSSIREFAKVVEIPSTTLTSALEKGIGGMAVDRVIKICDILNIDVKTFDPIEVNNISIDQECFNIKDVIKSKREELGLTYQQLGDMVGVGKSTIRKWETGLIENMKRDSIIALANALNISPITLLGDVFSSNSTTDNKKTTVENNISIKGNKLLYDFNKLNDLGKKKVLTYTKDLTELSKYAKSNSEFKIDTIAAHNDHLDESDEMEKIMQDLDDMDKW